MKIVQAIARKAGMIPVIGLTVLFTATTALAAENPEGWRTTYDAVMSWVNFFILAALIYKFGKGPITEFLNGRRLGIEDEIGSLEKQRNDIKATTEETFRNLETSREHFQEISEKIIKSGEKARQAIIDEAKTQSQLLLEDSKRKLQYQIKSVQQNFKAELIDASMDLAIKRIQSYVTPKDNEKFLEQYFSAVSSRK